MLHGKYKIKLMHHFSLFILSLSFHILGSKTLEYVRIVDEIELNSEKSSNDADYVARIALLVCLAFILNSIMCTHSDPNDSYQSVA